MSTESGNKQPAPPTQLEPPSKASAFFTVTGPHQKDEALEIIQKKLEGQIEARKEERFYWVSGLCITVDIFMFPQMQTWSAPVCIALLELLVLISLGRRWGVDHIWTITEKLIDKWDGRLGKGKE